MNIRSASRNRDQVILTDAHDEFIGALEAATGKPQTQYWNSPMTGEHVLDGMTRLLMSERPDRGLNVLERSGVLQAVLPEVAALVGFGEGTRHKDVWAHTKQVIRQTPFRENVRWAALLHDIGKVATRRFEPNGQVTFIGHPEVGARQFDRIRNRLSFLPGDAQKIRFLIASHLRSAAYAETWTDSAVRRFARDAGENLRDLLDLSRADITSKYEEKVRRGLQQIDLLASRVEKILKEDAKPPSLPTGLGSVLIERFGIPPGPGLGRLMDQLRSDVEEGLLGVGQEFGHYIEYIEKHPEIIKGIH